MSWLIVQEPTGWHSVLSSDSLEELKRLGEWDDLEIVRGGPGDPLDRRDAAVRLADRLDRYRLRDRSPHARLA